MRYCPHCKVKIKTHFTPVQIALIILLFCCFYIPGIVYGFVHKRKCPICGTSTTSLEKMSKEQKEELEEKKKTEIEKIKKEYELQVKEAAKRLERLFKNTEGYSISDIKKIVLDVADNDYDYDFLNFVSLRLSEFSRDIVTEALLEYLLKHDKSVSKDIINSYRANEIRWIEATNRKVAAIKKYVDVKDKDETDTEAPVDKWLSILACYDKISGCYILHNTTKNMYYVGKAQDIYSRVRNHFNGRGNGDVYADYKYGDKFLMSYIPLNGSKYNSLDKLEYDLIKAYDCIEPKGYNKNSGNEE